VPGARITATQSLVPDCSTSIVYYSGSGEAGITTAAPIATAEFVESAASANWETSSADTCGSSQADGFTPGPNVLVDWSMGRLAPSLFLTENPGRAGEIDTIWLLDPGDAELLNGNDVCDHQLATTPGTQLNICLTGDSDRRLIILSGDETESDNRAGLTALYLDDINGAAARSQTLLCRITPGEISNHDNRLVEFFIPFTTGPPVCPARTTHIGLGATEPDPPEPNRPSCSPPIGEQLAGSGYANANGRAGAVVRLYAAVFAASPMLPAFSSGEMTVGRHATWLPSS
jgi:hypothetical protein